MATKIEWCNETINPLRTKDGGYHCTKVSRGCDNCYAEGMNHRFGNQQPYERNDNVEFVIAWDQVEKIYKWKKPRRVFFQSMSDMFHEKFDFNLVNELMQVIAKYQQHTFIILTKRPERALEFFSKLEFPELWLENLLIGVSVEDQVTANQRVPILERIPLMTKVVSVEPLIGPIDFHHLFHPIKVEYFDGTKGWGYRPEIDWVIVGGETGRGAREMKPEWVYKILGQCDQAKIHFFFKHWGVYRNGQKVGKKLAGRILYGMEYNEIPKRLDQQEKEVFDAIEGIYSECEMIEIQ